MTDKVDDSPYLSADQAKALTTRGVQVKLYRIKLDKLIRAAALTGAEQLRIDLEDCAEKKHAIKSLLDDGYTVIGIRPDNVKINLTADDAALRAIPIRLVIEW